MIGVSFWGGLLWAGCGPAQFWPNENDWPLAKLEALGERLNDLADCRR
jgi:hypothetical protein